MTGYRFITYETLDEGTIARIMLNRPEARNAQSRGPTRHTHGGSRAGALRKITIAQVHGPVYAAGLMIAWACDLITAADDTVFADVVGTRLGMCGVEYFAHPWELGPRRAKELLLTGGASIVGTPEFGVPHWKSAPPVQPLVKDRP